MGGGCCDVTFCYGQHPLDSSNPPGQYHPPLDSTIPSGQHHPPGQHHPYPSAPPAPPPPDSTPPRTTPLLDSTTPFLVNERSVRILLECLLFSAKNHEIENNLICEGSHTKIHVINGTVKSHLVFDVC